MDTGRHRSEMNVKWNSKRRKRLCGYARLGLDGEFCQKKLIMQALTVLECGVDRRSRSYCKTSRQESDGPSPREIIYFRGETAIIPWFTVMRRDQWRGYKSFD